MAVCLILILPLFSYSQEDECSHIELTARGRYMQDVPVTNQVGPLCSVHAANVMLQAYGARTGQEFDLDPNEYVDRVERENSQWRDANVPGRVCNVWNVMRSEFSLIPECHNFGFVGNSRELHSPEEFAGKLHEILVSGAQPLPPVIEYCGRILGYRGEFIHNRIFQEDLNYLNGTENEEQENFSPVCRFHASAVVGRKRIRGVCHFLVQNSEGHNCDAYPNYRRCENGRIWIPENELSQNIFRLIFLQD